MTDRPEKTLSDVLEAVQESPCLSLQTRRDLTSAVRRVANLVSPDGLTFPADPGLIAARLSAIAPAMAGLTQASLSNVKSRFRRALKLSGINVHPGKQTNQLLPEWLKARDLVGNRPQWRALSRLAHFASAQGLRPSEISDTHMERFRRMLFQEAIHLAPQNAFDRTCKKWNDCCATIPGWPGQRVSVSARRKPYVVPEDTFPDSLRQEIKAHFDSLVRPAPFSILDACGKSSPFSSPERRPIGPRTAALRKFQLLQYLSALIATGVPADEMTSFAAVTIPEVVARGLTFLYERAGNRMSIQIGAIGNVLAAIAKDWVDASRAAEIRAMLRDATRRRGMSPKVEGLLRQFDDPRNRQAVFDLPNRLAKEARYCKSITETARLFEATFAIELLINCPIRIGNLVSLDIDKHFIRSRPGPKGMVHLVIPADEVKNGQQLEFELPPHLARLLSQHIAEYRRHLPGSSSRWLFPRGDGTHEIYRNLSSRLSCIIRRYTGIRMTAHMFRHFGAEAFLEMMPAGHEVIRRTLGHSCADTAPRYYIRRNMPKAAKMYAETILKLRQRGRRRRRSVVDPCDGDLL
jgi:integrase